MEAKAKAGEEDLSMEEILQSIRKIIADDGDEAKPDAVNGHANGSVGASDILELTDAIEEAPAPTPVISAQSATDDILNSIDMALATPAPVAAPIPAVAPTPVAMNDQAYIDSLLSTESATAASSAFKKLAPVEAPIAPPQLSPSPVFQSGNTVEAMVMNSLRPMLKEWLDANLPKIVEHIVEREVRKLAH